MKKCPFCAEEIKDEALVCKHCRMSLSPNVQTNVQASQQPTTKKNKAFAYLLLFFTGGLGGHQFYIGDWRRGVGYIILIILSGVFSAYQELAVSQGALAILGIFLIVDLFQLSKKVDKINGKL